MFCYIGLGSQLDLYFVSLVNVNKEPLLFLWLLNTIRCQYLWLNAYPKDPNRRDGVAGARNGKIVCQNQSTVPKFDQTV